MTVDRRDPAGDGPRDRPRVKVCGVVRPREAEWAADLGADFVGLNFHPPSPRWVDPVAAREIADAVRGRLRLVGVFVHRPLAEVEEIGRAVGLDLYQLHGDESAAEVAAVGERAIKVFRVRQRLDPAVFDAFPDAWGFLVDYRDARLFGGSGRSWDFSSLAGAPRTKPLFIAGGLGPHNVRAAITAASPWGLDVCSGVEAAPGRKDRALLEQLFEEIDHAPVPLAS